MLGTLAITDSKAANPRPRHQAGNSVQVRQDPSKMYVRTHEDLAVLLQHLNTQLQGQYAALLGAPRAHRKSTWGKFSMMISSLYGRFSLLPRWQRLGLAVGLFLLLRKLYWAIGRARRRRRLAMALARKASARRQQSKVDDAKTSGSDSEDNEEPAPQGAPEAEIAQRLQFLASTKFVACLAKESFFSLFALLQKRTFTRGQHVFHAGEGLESATLGLWIVFEGAVVTYGPQGDRLCQYEHSESFGEFSLLLRRPVWPISAKAASEVVLYYLSRTSFESFVERNPTVLARFLETAVAREWRIASYAMDSVLKLFASSRAELQGDPELAFVGAYLEGHQKQASASEQQTKEKQRALPGTEVYLEDDELLFEKGERAECLYIVRDGQLSCFVTDSDGVEEETAIISTGSLVGGISLFGCTTRGESARALDGSVTLWRLDRQDVARLVQDWPARALNLLRAVGAQLGPTCAQFFARGLRTSLHEAGEELARGAKENVFVVISGRIRAFARRPTQTVFFVRRRNILYEVGFPGLALIPKKSFSKLVAKTLQTIRKNSRDEIFLTINGSPDVEPFENVEIPDDVFRKHDLVILY
eukprot:g53814.t1